MWCGGGVETVIGYPRTRSWRVSSTGNSATPHRRVLRLARRAIRPHPVTTTGYPEQPRSRGGTSPGRMVLPGATTFPSPPPHPPPLTLGAPDAVPGNVGAQARRRWQEKLAVIGGRSPLTRFEDTPRTRIELSTTHPGGLPQFITGKSTLLSSLIRDELALRNARIAAAEITQRGIELWSVRGIESVHLAIGLASWRT